MNYISLEEIFKYGKGFEFYNKHNSKFVVHETKTKTHHIAHGILGDKYNDVDYITAVCENGKIFEFCSSTFNTIGNNIFNIRYEKDDDWYKPIFLKKPSETNLQKQINKDEIISYLEMLIIRDVDVNEIKKGLKSVVDVLNAS